MQRCAEGTTYLNIPAKAENISYYDDINSALEARGSLLPKCLSTDINASSINNIIDEYRKEYQHLNDKGSTQKFAYSLKLLASNL